MSGRERRVIWSKKVGGATLRRKKKGVAGRGYVKRAYVVYYREEEDGKESREKKEVAESRFVARNKRRVG